MTQKEKKFRKKALIVCKLLRKVACGDLPLHEALYLASLHINNLLESIPQDIRRRACLLNALSNLESLRSMLTDQEDDEPFHVCQLTIFQLVHLASTSRTLLTSANGFMQDAMESNEETSDNELSLEA